MKSEKCVSSSITFLGYEVQQRQLLSDPAKVHAVVEWPTSASRRQLRRLPIFTVASYEITPTSPQPSDNFSDMMKRKRRILSDPNPGPILPSSCVLGSVIWEVEERIPSCTEAPPNRLIIPESVHSDVLQWGHSSQLACHPGLAQPLHLLQQRFWWPSMTQDVRSLIATCPMCAHGKMLP